MLRRSIPFALFLAGCAANDGTGMPSPSERSGTENAAPASSEVDVTHAEDLDPLAEISADGHLVRFYLVDGDLLIAERGPIGESSVLEGLPSYESLTELYSHFVEGPVPQAIREYDDAQAALVAAGVSDTERADAPASSQEVSVSETTTGSPEIAATPGSPRLLHENGASHFRSSHCASEPSSTAWATWRLHEKHTTPAREFCWASGFTGSWTESAEARLMTHEVAAVRGNVCYTLSTSEGTNLQFDIFQNEQWLFNWANSLKCSTSGCPPWPFACAGCNVIARKREMRGRVHCASGDLWRWGGGFWK